MPGFDAVDLDDWHIFTMLVTAMATIERYVKFRGLIYVDAFDNVRATNSAHKILTWVKLFCGNEYMPNVTIVTTKWDKQDDDEIEEKLESFACWSKGDLLQPLLSHGAKVFHHGLIRDNNNWQKLKLKKKPTERALYAKRMIHEHYGDPSNIPLQVYREIADGHTIDTTTAGSWLRAGSAFSQNTNPNPTDQGKSWQFLYQPNIRLMFQGPDIPEEPTATHNNTGTAPPPQNGSADRPQTRPEPSTSWVPWIRLLLQAAQIFFNASAASTAKSEQFPASEFEDEDFRRNGYGFREGQTFQPSPAGTSWSCAVM